MVDAFLRQVVPRDRQDGDRRSRDGEWCWRRVGLKSSRGRSRSVNAGRRGDDDHQQRHGADRRDDRRDKHRVVLPVLDHRKIDPKLVQRLKDGSVIPASGLRRRGNSPTPSRRSSKAPKRGRSPCRAFAQTRRLASVAFLDADGPAILAPTQPICAPGSSASPSRNPTPRSATRILSCARVLDFTLPPVSATPSSPCAFSTPCGDLGTMMSDTPASTPVHGLGGSPARTPTDGDRQDPDDGLFTLRRSPLLPLPPTISPRPPPPAARRKTLAGVTGFNLQRSSARYGETC